MSPELLELLKLLIALATLLAGIIKPAKQLQRRRHRKLSEGARKVQKTLA